MIQHMCDICGNVINPPKRWINNEAEIIKKEAIP